MKTASSAITSPAHPAGIRTENTRPTGRSARGLRCRPQGRNAWAMLLVLLIVYPVALVLAVAYMLRLR